MINPYSIDIGEKLYRDLFDDYRRPKNFTVQQWVVCLIEEHLSECIRDGDNEF